MALQDIANIANVVVAFGVLIALTQNTISRKQLHLGTIARCIEAFRNIGSLKDPTEEQIFKYVDLVNEELFYFQHKYVPKVIAYEWLDGMIDYIPLCDVKGNVLCNSKFAEVFQENSKRFFQFYPRLKVTFTISNVYDFDLLANDDKGKVELKNITRRKIIEEMYINVTNYEY